MHEITQQVGGQLSKRYESKMEAVDKLMKENEKLTKQLEKQGAIKDRLRESKASLQVAMILLSPIFATLARLPYIL